MFYFTCNHGLTSDHPRSFLCHGRNSHGLRSLVSILRWPLSVFPAAVGGGWWRNGLLGPSSRLVTCAAVPQTIIYVAADLQCARSDCVSPLSSRHAAAPIRDRVHRAASLTTKRLPSPEVSLSLARSTSLRDETRSALVSLGGYVVALNWKSWPEWATVSPSCQSGLQWLLKTRHRQAP